MPDEPISFVSSNRWDEACAHAAGLRTYWVRRANGIDEYLNLPPDEQAEDLKQLIA